MEKVQDIVIAGAGIAGLTTSLRLHRLGIRSIVLESSDSLRISGAAITLWTNAWKALDLLGVADSLRSQHIQLTNHGRGDHEIRCVRRKILMETLASELPRGTIRFSSKLVSIEELGFLTLVHLADGTTIKTKVLIGCDGVNSIVAKWLGLKKPAFSGRYAIRGLLDFRPSTHGLGSSFMQFFTNGTRSGFVPCNDHTIYWFITWTSSDKGERELEENPAELKKFVQSKLEQSGEIPSEARAIVEESDLDCFVSAPLRYRRPWELVWGNIYRGSVAVAGDAFHPMTPDLGQGGGAAMEDGIVLARCLAEAFSVQPSREPEREEEEEEEQYKRIEMGLSKYARERKWRSIKLITGAYVVGFIQQSDGIVINFLRDKILRPLMTRFSGKMADYDCSKVS